MVKLNVPLWGQPQRHNQCVPTCIKMALEHLRTKHGESIPRLSIKRISKIVNMKIDGTIPKDVENINTFLCNGNPVVVFKTDILGNFRQIKKEIIEKETPVIVWINNADPPDEVWHAVVVIGFDPETNTVTYNEPLDRSEKDEEVGIFTSKWGFESRMARVNVIKTQQRQIREWASNIVEGETNK